MKKEEMVSQRTMICQENLREKQYDWGNQITKSQNTHNGDIGQKSECRESRRTCPKRLTHRSKVW